MDNANIVIISFVENVLEVLLIVLFFVIQIVKHVIMI